MLLFRSAAAIPCAGGLFNGLHKSGKLMRTGAEYRAALRDGRRVWVLAEGLVEDVPTHPATRAMVDEYAAWYDLHLDPEWAETLFPPGNARDERRAWAYTIPRTSDDLRGMG